MANSLLHPMPFTRMEIAVLGLVDKRLQVLLVRREHAPHPGQWALPGGVLRIDLDASLEAAARRVLRERLGLELPFLRQLCAVGGSHRDPRAPWALSVVYRAMAMASQLAPLAGKRVKQVTWLPVEDVMKDRALAFDHAALVAMAVETTRQEIEQLELPAGILPPQFTLSELQADCEQLLGRRLDKSSFRRRLADRALVEPVHGVTRAGANRPAQVYRLRRVPEPQDNKA
ncbi:NUDIX domain-containing protein [Thermomonas sp.]|uniref:NUDIX hydrolase n=1 Tax=Thermomonas sp. TaxID=1971895 RepID=UPI002C816CBF|nr:NUDIX domain-containing protein [Thermomonas sp.]HRO62333.1 NUDIX domain-containing protein [Thermomonas sp.]